MNSLIHKQEIMKDIPPVICIDCGKIYPALFCVRDEIWDCIFKTGEDKNKILCFSCTEKRLGRELTWNDIEPCLLTNGMFLGAILNEREKIRNIDIEEL